MTKSPILHVQHIRLSYADTDPAGILYFAAWFPKMEGLQSEFMYLQGLRQDTLKKERGWWTVTRATECEYLAAAELYDLIRMELSIGRIGNSSFAFEYQMWRESDDLLVARGSITIVAVSPEQETVPLPGDLRALVERWASEGALRPS
ncbi:acyl-CoA thioesterase [Parahaliea sp. F7430]|uniref:Acyl-CoA thioesterase n=1 Tax=Sediminihaliea albiluteola TaxID=2758564 RepID=A0A7W2YJM0_9GAMM|nr:thioesterase family protein [Sediminihaliea albiluteola]MBA6413736.1 acyl-CoA thioesterase [Sediminihaliea albiluteola]